MDEIKIKPPRFSYLIPIPFILFLMGIFYWVAFEKEDEEEVGTGLKIIAVLVLIVGSFLLYQFTRQFIRVPVILLMNNQGFEYNPAGVSSQFIGWEEVAKVEEVSVRVLRGRNTGGWETALGVWLKDPGTYRSRMNAALGFLVKQNEKMYGATLLIEPASLGKEYEEVRRFFKRKIPGEGV